MGYDLIWSNPPIRVGKQVLHELMRTWLPRLLPGGEAYLVVQRNLGSDSLQRWLAAELPDLQVSRHASAKAFRVLRVARPDTEAGLATPGKSTAEDLVARTRSPAVQPYR